MPSLKSLLVLDAVTCAVTGIALIAGAQLLDEMTAIPAGLSFFAGVLLLPVAAFMAIVTARFSSNAPAVWLIIAGNGAWVVASLLVVAAGLVRPNLYGIAFILIQAAAVTGLVLLEFSALRACRTRFA